MSKTDPVNAEATSRALIDNDKYVAMYQESIDSPTEFWTKQANEFLTWDRAFSTINEADLSRGETRWFADGELNASVNCIDRHLPARANQTAIIWEGDDPNDDAKVTYQELHDKVCQLAKHCKRGALRKAIGLYLYAYDPRGSLRHASLYSHRCNSFRGVRRFFTASIAGPDFRL